MSGANNFLQFDPNRLSMLSDEDYANSLSRENGVSAGQASAALHNKLFFQVSTFVAAFAKAISDSGFNTLDYDFNTLLASIQSYSKIDKVWPVGSIYINATNNANPHDLLGFGTWVACGQGRMLLGVGNSHIAGATGGEETHIITTAEMPSHIHAENVGAYDADWGQQPNAPTEGAGYVTGSNDSRIKILNTVTTQNNTDAAGGDEAHNNMPPFVVVYMWQRTA